MISENEIRSLLKKWRDNNSFWNNSMDTETGIIREHYCRILEYILQEEHNWHGYQHPEN